MIPACQEAGRSVRMGNLFKFEVGTPTAAKKEAIGINSHHLQHLELTFKLKLLRMFILTAMQEFIINSNKNVYFNTNTEFDIYFAFNNV